MKESILKNKSYHFALLIIETYKSISSNKKEFTLTRQLLKSGTSIGANIREAEFAQSNKNFISKMSIALKASSETEYWLMLLKDSDYLESQNFNKLIDLNQELIKM